MKKVKVLQNLAAKIDLPKHSLQHLAAKIDLPKHSSATEALDQLGWDKHEEDFID